MNEDVSQIPCNGIAERYIHDTTTSVNNKSPEKRWNANPSFHKIPRDGDGAFVFLPFVSVVAGGGEGVDVVIIVVAGGVADGVDIVDGVVGIAKTECRVSSIKLHPCRAQWEAAMDTASVQAGIM